jgi:hypothetical protein
MDWSPPSSAPSSNLDPHGRLAAVFDNWPQ